MLIMPCVHAISVQQTPTAGTFRRMGERVSKVCSTLCFSTELALLFTTVDQIRIEEIVEEEWPAPGLDDTRLS
jgi:hypothetical protein